MIGRHRALGEDMIRVLVAENSRIHSRLLADALKSDPLLEVTPFEAESSGLVAAIIAEEIDVLVISSTLDEHPSRGIEILQDLRSLHRDTRCVMLLASSKDEIVLRAFRAGARGLFSKNDPLEHLSECVRAVYQGKVWANDHAMGVAVDALAASPAVRASNANGMKLLSKRELQVVRSLAEGLTNREIAEQLNLSPHTIKNYLFRIFDKLGVSSRIELLFMTLSQNEAAPSLPSRTSESHPTVDYSHTDTALLEKSAEAGLPAAQLALAQIYFFRRRDPQDLISAYMWYLVASERALLARVYMTKLMKPEQIEEAKHKATLWLSKMKKNTEAAASQKPGEIPGLRDPRIRSLPLEGLDS